MRNRLCCLMMLGTVSGFCRSPSACLQTTPVSKGALADHTVLRSSSLRASRRDERESRAFSTMTRRKAMRIQFLSANLLLLLPAAAAAAVTTNVDMKHFIDPQGQFALLLPARFFTLRRRGSSTIFTAGDMAKAEVIAVERYPIQELLSEQGIRPTGDLTAFDSLGDPTAIANLVMLHRNKGSQYQTFVLPESVRTFTSDEKDVLQFTVRTEIDVSKPELLMEQMGVPRLFRTTLVKSFILREEKGGIPLLLAVFASALEQDFNGEDGIALKQSVDSFVPLP